MKANHWILPGLLAIAVAACKPAQPPADAGSAQRQPAPAPAAPAARPAAPGKQSGTAERPSLHVTTIDGKSYDLAAHRGNWVVVNFWATWCAPCLKEMPDLSALDAMRGHVDVVGLAYEDIDPADLRAFLGKHPVVYPIAIVDTYQPPKDFAPPIGLPTTYLIAPDGRVARHFVGPVTAADVESAIAAAGGPKAG